MTELLSARAVTYRVGGATLLAGVDIAVSAGELVAVIGPNGAGKSTLLSVLAGDIPPTTGRVHLGGAAVADLDSAELAGLRAALGAGRTPDIPFSVAEVVAMGARAAGAAGSTAAEAAMAAMDVANLAGRVVGSLSGGEHTRVELARILAQDTDVILLDEPLAALDIAHEERVMRHLRSVAEAGKGVLGVIHDLNAAAAHAHRFVLMAGGRVLADGTAGHVLDERLLTEAYDHPMSVRRVESRLVILPRD